MKHRLLPVFAALFVCSWSVAAVACEHEKKTSAAAAEAAKACAAARAAVTADAKSGCSAHGASAVTADAKGACGAHATTTMAANGSCRAFGVSIVTASHEACAGHAAKASMASKGDACCAGKSVKAAKSTMAARRGTDAVVAGSSCQAGAKLTQGVHDCDACAELAICDEELSRIGIETQVVPLKNGVMVVYTAVQPGKSHAIQNAMARRNDRLHTLTTMGDQVKLCAECKAIRGAMASGKLTRETVNIGGGVLTVMTSDDPAMVAKLQGMEHRKT